MRPNVEIFTLERIAAVVDGGLCSYVMRTVLVAVNLRKAWRAVWFLLVLIGKRRQCHVPLMAKMM